MKVVELKGFLFQKFLDWQKESGQRRSLGEWAKYLGVPQTSLSTWMNGPYLPKGSNLGKLAAKLGPEIYDVLGMTRPIMETDDPDLQAIIKDWPKLNSEERRALIDQLNTMRAGKSKNALAHQ
jgi:hypothetical protein